MTILNTSFGTHQNVSRHVTSSLKRTRRREGIDGNIVAILNKEIEWHQKREVEKRVKNTNLRREREDQDKS
jgi:hypothetical protein